MNRRDRLGKGLGALLGEYLEPESGEGEVRTIPLDHIVPNPHQPRREFSETELDELAASIQENGLLQPLVVRPAPGSRDRYELVAGERRFRALGRLGRAEAPALVREASDETLLVLALVENLQREALSALEEADGYRALADQFGMTQAQIASAVGKSRSTVANLLRLLDLPPSVRKLLQEGSLTMGHARALLGVADDVRAGQLARAAVREGWSVREVERRVSERRPGSGDAAKAPAADPVVVALERALQERLGTRVKIRRGKKKDAGVIEITFHGPDDFDRVFELVTGSSAAEAIE